MVKLNNNYHITKKGVTKKNPVKLRYVLTYKNVPLRYFYANGNGDSVKDIIGFSWNEYFVYSSLAKVNDKKESMLRQLDTRQEEILNDTYNKVRAIIVNLQTGWLNEN